MSTPTLMPSPTSDAVGAATTRSRADRFIEWLGPGRRFIWRSRLAAVCILLTGLMFIQSPGSIAADTKLDLTQNPSGLMGRALQMWDPDSFSGTLQNQAYGYLWPMGPFYWLGEQSGLPVWAVQRLWWSLLLCLAFLGMVRLIRVLNMGSPAVRMLAGLAYALSPMLLSKLGTISSEVLPIALAPWMLIPLVLGAQRGSTRRWAALSGVAIFCIGGVNAVATAAVLPLGFLWILTRQRSRRTASLLGWWCLAVCLACLWWAIPLVLLGKYSPPFLDWIESASITTINSDPFSVLRGTSDWLASLSTNTGPTWWMGWLFVTNAALILASAAIAAMGLAGIALRTPHQAFISLSALFGFTVLGLGYAGATDGFGSEQVRELFDGPLAPLRNLHKFDPVLRVALVLGMAWLLTRSLEKLHERRGDLRPDLRRILGLGPTLVALVAVGLTLIAVATAPMTKNRTYIEIPDYWNSAAAWLRDQGDSGKALVVPGASFAQYLWGRTQDEPFQAAGGVAWDVRDAVPLGNAGHTRLLDAVSTELLAARSSKGLATALERSGYEWLVVRNDVDPAAVPKFARERVRATLQLSPGVEPAATFGPDVGPIEWFGYEPDAGVSGSFPAVEVYRVGGAIDTKPAVVRDASHPLQLAGGAEALVTTAQAGVVTDGAVSFQGNPGSEALGGLQVGTDTLRRREVNFGNSTNSVGNTLTSEDQFVQARKSHDYLDSNQVPLSVAELDGVAAVTASSSAAFADSLVERDPSAQPFSALDGDFETAWITGSYGTPVGQWWQVDFKQPIDVKKIKIALWRTGKSVQPTSIKVVTDQSSVDVDVTNKEFVDVALDGRATSTLRIVLTGVQGGSASPYFGIREVTIPGVTPARPVRIKTGGPVSAAVLATVAGEQSDCILINGQFRCSQAVGKVGAERAGLDRWVWLRAGSYSASVGAFPRAGAGLDELLRPLKSVVAIGSSQEVSSPAGSAQLVTDADPSTTWLASRLDRHPTVTLKLPEPRVISGVRVTTSSDVPVSKPFQVRVTVNGKTFNQYLANGDTIEIPKTRTNAVTVEVVNSSLRRSITDGVVSYLPVGISEIQLLGATDLQRAVPPDFVSQFACGYGPTVTIDKEKVLTSGSMSIFEMMHGSPQRFDGCGPGSKVRLAEGWHRISVAPTAQLLINGATILPTSGIPTPSAATNPQIEKWGAVDREVTVAANANRRTLETYESFNPGWTASVGGQQLQPVQVDGWRQGWLLPAGAAGSVILDYGPNSLYRIGLLVGLGAVLILIALAAVAGRRVASDPAGPAAWSKVIAASVVICALLTVGVIGSVVAVVLVGAAAWICAGRRRFAAAITIGLVLVAAAVELWSRWPDSRSEPTWVSSIQTFAVLCAVLLSVVSGLDVFVARRRRHRVRNPGP